MNIIGITDRETPEIIYNRINAYEQNDFEKAFQKAIEKNDDTALRKSCMEMEKIFLAMLFKQMKATVPKSSLIPRSQGAYIIESFIDDTLVEEVSKSSSFGLAKMLYNQLK